MALKTLGTYAQKKHYIRCTEILSDEEQLDCVYLLEDYCTAQQTAIAGRSPGLAGYYEPTVTELKAFCNSGAFINCPRFKAYQAHLKLIGLQK
ncbi:MAG: hypothetical protein ABSF63_03110 [Candidatus Bathyarchaeia archaeon]